MKLSVVIPAHNEADSIGETVTRTVTELERAGIDHEILVIDDASGDGTADVVTAIAAEHPSVRCVRSHLPPGLRSRRPGGTRAVHGRRGGDHDGRPVRFSAGPRPLLPRARAGLRLRVRHALRPGRPAFTTTRVSSSILNRMANAVIRVLFHHGYNDTTNAFKAYRRYVVDQLQPLLSNHFNLTVELPLKAIVRGYSYAVVPGQLDEPAARRLEAESPGDGQPLPVHRPIRVARASPQSRRLPAV